MSSRYHNSAAAINQFVDYYKIADNHGLVRYHGTIRFEYGNGQEEVLVADIQITRDGSQFRINLLDGVPIKFPASFSDYFDEIDFEYGKSLKVSGNYKHSGLGKYVANIYHQII